MYGDEDKATRDLINWGILERAACEKAGETKKAFHFKIDKANIMPTLDCQASVKMRSPFKTSMEPREI